MKTALLIVDHFPPSFAPRMGYLCKYLKSLGWTARVFSVKHPSKINKFDNLVGYVPAEEVLMPSYSQSHAIDKLLIEIGGRFCGALGWSMYDQKMYKHIKKEITNEHYDVVLCSTASFFPLSCAYKIAQKLRLPLILDFRDIYEQDPYAYSTKGLAGMLRKIHIKNRNKIISKANAITTISEWHKEYLSKHNGNIHLIYNGFDEELFYPHNEAPTSQFNITYTGSVAPTDCIGSRDPELFFQAIGELHTQGKLDHKTFCVNFYTDDKSKIYLKQVADKYGIGQYIHITEWVSSKDIPSILAESNVLLILVAAKNTHGVMGTKLYEYLAMKRQILCVPETSGPVVKIMTDAGAGHAFDNTTDIRNYLETHYNIWKATGYVPCSTNWEYVRQFSRELQAKQFVEIFEKTTKEKFTDKSD